MIQNRLFDRMAKCRNQKDAIKLAAEFVMLHTADKPFRISTLMEKFGGAIEDLVIADPGIKEKD